MRFNLAKVDVLEFEMRAVMLKLDLTYGIDRFVSLPVVLHGHILNYQYIV